MARDDGIRIGAGGAIIQEIAHEKAPVPDKPVTIASEKKVEILEETVRDHLPSDMESDEVDEE